MAEEFEFFCDERGYTHSAPTITAAEMKRKAGCDMSWFLYRYGRGEPDTQYTDAQSVDLRNGSKYFYTAPTATTVNG